MSRGERVLRSGGTTSMQLFGSCKGTGDLGAPRIPLDSVADALEFADGDAWR